MPIVCVPTVYVIESIRRSTVLRCDAIVLAAGIDDGADSLTMCDLIEYRRPADNVIIASGMRSNHGCWCDVVGCVCACVFMYMDTVGYDW